MKRWLSLLFVAVMLFSAMALPLQTPAATEDWTKVGAVTAGKTYLFTCTIGIKDGAGVAHKSCVLKSVQSADPHGLAYCEFTAYDDDSLWTVEDGNGGYYLKSVDSGKYLNMQPGPNGKGFATLSTNPQALQITFSGGTAKISVNLSGTTYYIRFTNAYYRQGSVSCWEAAKEDGSNTFAVYGKAGPDPEYKNTTKPLFSVACFSDLHVDYGIQSWATPIRKSTITSAEYVRDQLGGVDVVLVGGDITSNNGKKTWTVPIFQKVQKTVYETLAIASKSGKVMFVSGNHENEAGINSGDTMYTGNYDSYMTGNIGPFGQTLYLNEIVGTSKFNELLCYRYTVGKMEFIGINTPYRTTRSNGYIYLEQIQWVEKQLKAIGKDKTVVVFCHYPIGSIDNAPGQTGANAAMKKVLESYPNVVYCYGHVHGDDSKYTWYNTSELVVPHGTAVRLKNNAYQTSGYLHCHMGSMGYYMNQFNNYKYLEAAEPGINQLLKIDFYSDHITFKYYNTGEKTAVDGGREIASYTVVRDMTAQLGGTPPSSDMTTNVSTSTATSTKTTSTKTNTASDSATQDSGTPSDTGTVTDGGTKTDEATTDVSTNSGTDTNLSTGPVSSGTSDLGTDSGDASAKDSMSVGVILGIVFASVGVLLALGGGGVWFFLLRKKP